MPGIGMMVRKDARAAEESRQDHIAPGGVRGAGSQQVGRNDSEQRAQLENIPSLAPQDGNRRPFPRKRIAFARDGLDQRGLAASVGSKNAHVLSGCDLQGHIVESRTLLPRPAQDGHVFQGEQWRRRTSHFRLEVARTILA